MKKILFATTALAGMAIGGVASAEIALFGSARLGIGYNIRNNGTVDIEEVTNDDGEIVRFEGSEDLRAVSRIRFGVTMTGESDSGITFGATIRADNAKSGGTGDSSSTGQTEGDVFVSGAWGTLTFGDTSGADEQHVGDAGGNVSLTGLGDFNETIYVSNGGGFGDNDRVNFANNPEARPTVRYDYSFGGLGVSASTNRNLNDVGVGASYTFDFMGNSLTGGVGYYDFNEFDTGLIGTGDDTILFRGGEQYSAGLTGTVFGLTAGVVYTKASTGSSDDTEFSGDFDVIYGSLGYTSDVWTVVGYYNNVLKGEGILEAYDGRDLYGVGVQYDLGGGASINAGVQRSYGRDNIGEVGDADFLAEIEDDVIADFGIKMSF